MLAADGEFLDARLGCRAVLFEQFSQLFQSQHEAEGMPERAGGKLKLAVRVLGSAKTPRLGGAALVNQVSDASSEAPDTPSQSAAANARRLRGLAGVFFLGLGASACAAGSSTAGSGR